MKLVFSFLLLFFSLPVILNANNIIDINAKLKQSKMEKKKYYAFFFIFRDVPIAR